MDVCYKIFIRDAYNTLMTEEVKKPDLLKESSRNFDFFDFQGYAKNLKKNLRSSTSPTVTVLIGAYGTGKSVLLNEVCKLTVQSSAKRSPKWVFFECWQYPDKRDLWEALILDVVEEIGGKNKREKMLRSYSNIATWRERLTKYLSDIKTALATMAGITLVSWLVLAYADEHARNAFLALVTAVILVLLSSIEFLSKPESKSSISRLSDYKKELENTLRDYEGTLYIVLEDIDRAGELGRQFFETVSYFIKQDEFANKNIKLVVPVADPTGNDKQHLRDSIDKASDNILYFEPSYNCEKYISEVFSAEFLDTSTKQLLLSTIGPLLGRQISVRKLKQTLRNAIVKHNRLLDKDFDSRLAICLAIEFSKYMPGSSGEHPLFKRRSNYEHKPLFEWALQNQMIELNSSDPQKYIEPRNYFEVSDEVFAGIHYRDMPTNSYRGSGQVHYRYFLISRTYFEDL